MNIRESLKAFLDLPEMRMIGSPQERAAFVAIQIERRTVREAARLFGCSKSQVTNLADLFLAKMAVKMNDLKRKPLPVSKEYLESRGVLLNQLRELQEESGSDDDWDGGLDPGSVSREDLAELSGTRLVDPDA